MLSHGDNYSFAVIDKDLYGLYIYFNIKVELHQSYRKATGYGLGGIAKKVHRYCPDDAISCCMYKRYEVLQQPIPSNNDYRGITCLILMLLK